MNFIEVERMNMFSIVSMLSEIEKKFLYEIVQTIELEEEVCSCLSRLFLSLVSGIDSFCFLFNETQTCSVCI